MPWKEKKVVEASTWAEDVLSTDDRRRTTYKSKRVRKTEQLNAEVNMCDMKSMIFGNGPPSLKPAWHDGSNERPEIRRSRALSRGGG